MSKPPTESRKFRPNPKRQVILVVLAIIGLAVGYGLGFVFKRPAPKPAPPPPQTTLPRPAPAMAEAPVLPDHDEPQPEGKVRAYEEALPREIIVVMEPLNPAKTAIKPHVDEEAPEPAPKAIPEPEPVPMPEPKTETARATPEPEPAPDAEAPAWRKFAVAAKPDGRPGIAIVMDDLGIDRGRTRRTIDLPGPLNLSFLAYAHELAKQADAGRGKGHEIWLHVPMEPGSKSVDPGPNVLLSGLKPAELAKSLKWNLDQLTGYVGINNHMGSRFTADADGMRAVMAELKQRGLAFLDSVTSPKSVGQKAAAAAGVPFQVRNVFIDHLDDIAAINRQLERVERLARNQGHAVAIGHPRETTLKALVPWLATLDAKGLQLVPLSSLLHIAGGTVAAKQ